MKINKCDFVVFLKNTNELPLNSVGIVKNISTDTATIFFVSIQKKIIGVHYY